MNDPQTQAEAADQLLELPRNVLVACPLTQPRVMRMDRCPTCPHWRGLDDRFGDGSKAPFAARYLVKCAAPRNLGLQEFVE